MSAGATVRILSAEEIAARAGGSTPWLLPPQPQSVFAERSMRLRQLAPRHPMEGFLRLVAALAQAQQEALTDLIATAGPAYRPDAAALEYAARTQQTVLSARDTPRPPGWRTLARQLSVMIAPHAPEAARDVLRDVAQTINDEALESQAQALLDGRHHQLDLAAAPVLAAALQVHWTHALIHLLATSPRALRRLDDDGLCPACGSRPVASLTRHAGEADGQRYLQCSLCSLQWHVGRIRCTHCGGERKLSYQSLDPIDIDAGADPQSSSARAAQALIQAETCGDCGHYLKIMHRERDPFVDPVADDLASLTLDLLVGEAGLRRHGQNLMLIFGAGSTDPGGG